ncbi:MAG TPA: acyl carrier protein [Actinocrinis sp.]|jgi:act minimal PKS acyl carrier protein|uniref:acyl carrier protein n=1 Tax=Actinocrinis sp. TaxID=1920516 RepID=UPI002DDCB910|nr:acyl carrier protein [Actinocrinis sp.]HEV3173012.1 acyl carrier protein [Actinocrinis sp.]
MSQTSTGPIDRELLVQMLRESAGVEEGVDLDGDILDTPFIELGYDSLALLQVTGRIQREYNLVLPDDAVSEAETLRELLELIQAAPLATVL